MCMMNLGPWTLFGIFKYTYYSLSFSYSSRMHVLLLLLNQSLQSQIPEGARPLCFILYADKAKLSSFGTEMAYPVVARCANLPTEIRNGHGVGGGRVVGWLPNVSSLADNRYLMLDCSRSRSRKLQRTLRSRHSSTSNVRSGITHFAA